jgi:hypothetical protein
MVPNGHTLKMQDVSSPSHIDFPRLFPTLLLDPPSYPCLKRTGGLPRGSGRHPGSDQAADSRSRPAPIILPVCPGVPTPKSPPICEAGASSSCAAAANISARSKRPIARGPVCPPELPSWECREWFHGRGLGQRHPAGREMVTMASIAVPHRGHDKSALRT